MPEALRQNHIFKTLCRHFKILILLFFAIISCRTNAQKANGYQINYNISGAKESEGNYKNSLQDSTWKYYFADGKINRITNYSKGVKNGRSLTYNRDGKLASDVNYKNGKFFDTIKFYYSNGQLNFKQYYDEKGLGQGEFKLWFKSGKLRQYCNMVNGKIIGKTTDYYEDGQIEEIGFYDNIGKKDSIWSYYSANGKLIKSEKYKADSLLKTIQPVVTAPPH